MNLPQNIFQEGLNHFMKDYTTNKRYRYSDHKRYLIFDCDAPKNIQEVINNAIGSEYKFNLLISNHFFETWLLMHFEDVCEKLTKKRLMNIFLLIIKKQKKGLYEKF